LGAGRGESGALESSAGGSRRDSHKRRRLSERRRLFGRSAGGQSSRQSQDLPAASFSASHERRKTSLLLRAPSGGGSGGGAGGGELGAEGPPLVAPNDHEKISMKIQLHITVAPVSEPLIMDHHQLEQDKSAGSLGGSPKAAKGHPHLQGSQLSTGATSSSNPSAPGSSSIGEHISERLSSRQDSLSQKRRQQLIGLHRQLATGAGEQNNNNNNNNNNSSSSSRPARSGSLVGPRAEAAGEEGVAAGRAAGEHAGRSSTISAGVHDEATARFLARQQPPGGRGSLGSDPIRSGSQPLGAPLGAQLQLNQALASSTMNIRQRQQEREHIYFKRDGQRFGHEFTLKLAVDKSYRCLLKVRPLIPLQAISIQGHQVAFVDCSGGVGVGSLGLPAGRQLQLRRSSNSQQTNHHLSSSAPSSSLALAQQQHLIAGNARDQPQRGAHSLVAARQSAGDVLQLNGSLQAHRHSAQLGAGGGGSKQSRPTSQQHPALSHAQTLGAPTEWASSQQQRLGQVERQLREQLLRQQQQQQMLRHFSSSSLGSTVGPTHHLSGQLVYMFDWSAARFQVNKNKNRTQIQTVLKFKNGQILSLPLQVKFYEPDCRQHLSWGSQLHFIDYDCQINSMGQISVERVQYY